MENSVDIVGARLQGFAWLRTLSFLACLAVGCADDTGSGVEDEAGDAATDTGDAGTGDADGASDAGDAREFDAHRFSRVESMSAQNMYLVGDQKAIYYKGLSFAGWYGYMAILLLDASEPERLRLEDYVIVKGDLWGERVGDQFMGGLVTEDGNRAELITARAEGDQLSVQVEDAIDEPVCRWLPQVPEPREEVQAVYCMNGTYWMIEFEDGQPRFNREVNVSESIASELRPNWDTGFHRGGITEGEYAINIEHGLDIFDLSADREGSRLAAHLDFEVLFATWDYDESRDWLYIAGESDEVDNNVGDDIILVDLSDPSSPNVIGDWSPWEELGLDAERYDSIAYPYLTLLEDEQALLLGCNVAPPGDGLCLVEMNAQGDELESIEYVPADDLPGAPEELAYPKLIDDRIYFGDIRVNYSASDLDFVYPEVGLTSISLDDVLAEFDR